MNWKLPNQLTVGRIGLAAVFFTLLGIYDSTAAWGPWVLNSAFIVYLLAGVTDVLDGHLARKWHLTTAFGRIADPFVDKVLVVGAFAMLAGSNYGHAAGMPPGDGGVAGWLTGGMSSAVQAWMVVVILAREFIVSAVRGYSESRGVKFPATYAGKIKMFVQSIAICTVLYQLANVPESVWASRVKVATVWAAVLVTVASGFVYVGKARKLLVGDE